ncbi:uncharacterized protein B0P05DRAFT_521601 [Gilbertella persicaria]|uniref:Uncharacterized protein n=1 Tax=Rhizopus stolonifer TaxID=4846 RepID=A0A367KI62_RHIST|nr:uncharacterized protein B0P05DRAFT_521601 [Gilbertella persicaria]KAI8098354.1 hypothetical protein B0P05DRAFT_521601 [Gilbertella persicaria]RCI01849.1 hypothetical protein CU098_010219 [Rhizopus stolonifer]
MDMSRKEFEAEKRKLMDKILVSVRQLKLTMETFNRNMETASRLGKQFKPPAEVWSAFHKAVQNNHVVEEGAESENEYQGEEPSSPSRLDLNIQSRKEKV